MFKATEAVEVVIADHNLHIKGTIRHVDAAHLVIQCQAKSVVNIPVGTIIRVMQMVNGSLYQMNTPLLRAQENAIAVPLVTPQVIQRRTRPRVDCFLPTWCKHELVIPTITVAGKEGQFLAVARDLSMGGARLYVRELVPAKTEMEFEIEIGSGEVIAGRAEILRCTPMPTAEAALFPDLHYALALRFIEISRMCQLALQRFVQNPPRPNREAMEKALSVYRSV